MSSVSRELKWNRYLTPIVHPPTRKNTRKYTSIAGDIIESRCPAHQKTVASRKISKRMKLEHRNQIICYTLIYCALKTAYMEPPRRRKMQRTLLRGTLSAPEKMAWQENRRRLIFTEALKNVPNRQKSVVN